MGYYKVELIDGKVYDFDKKCNSIIFDKGGYTVFIEDKESGDTNVLMYINKTEIRRIECVNDSEEVEIPSVSESNIEWITDRNPTEEEIIEHDGFFICTVKKNEQKFVDVVVFGTDGNWKLGIGNSRIVIAWSKIKPYQE